VEQRLDRHGLDLPDGLGLQLLDHLAERLDRGLEVRVELTDGAVVQGLHALGDGAGVHVDQNAGPVGGGLQHAGLVRTFVDVVAVTVPQQHPEDDRRHRHEAEYRGADSEPGHAATSGRGWLVVELVWHGREGTRPLRAAAAGRMVE
jgi:hypothetical protein